MEEMLADILFHYLNMGTSQFLRDFRRAHQIKKSAELRKRVLQRQERNREGSDKLPFEVIVYNDLRVRARILFLVKLQYLSLQ